MRDKVSWWLILVQCAKNDRESAQVGGICVHVRVCLSKRMAQGSEQWGVCPLTVGGCQIGIAGMR